MKNLLAFLAAAVLMFVGVGWYLDWFQIFNGPSNGDHYTVKVDFDAKKIKEDVTKAEEKAASAIDSARKDAAAHKAAASGSEPGATQWAEPGKPLIGSTQK